MPWPRCLGLAWVPDSPAEHVHGWVTIGTQVPGELVPEVSSCIDMRKDMCIDVCIDVHIDVHIDVCTDMCPDMCAAMRIEMLRHTI